MTKTYRFAACVATGMLGLAGQAHAVGFGSFGGSPMIGYGHTGGFSSYHYSPEPSIAPLSTGDTYSQDRVERLREQVKLHMQGCGCALCQALRATTS
ncbi:hypothetical protein QU481_02025 [Crenobacter sp. SG2303]|uniref:Uncharacterized protein n=1 Tax=Crenobacter oryzisoli TaxID=3056844 RepID=A0ABT7XIV4_9NEIS|nr:MULTISPECIES: hypothetical protein [unclassified Crenobacter]MDN0073670.1 hypothetical protein [Crenobacter sp. SG2303]MDN0084038.1 hypothetical protein [Crenobacter sp. SG2305]